MGGPHYSAASKRRFWLAIRDLGPVIADAAVAAGVSWDVGRRWFDEAGGVIPDLSEPSGFRLTVTEREEIAVLFAGGSGVRAIARALKRDPSTVSRELKRGLYRSRYRASTAQRRADRQARRPKPSKLATDLRLRGEVIDRLALNHSPEQISHGLAEDFSDDLSMRVSPETIYQSLYVQGRGGLRRELTVHLRTGRAKRKPRRRAGERRGQIKDMIMISERPPEVEDRAVPGHWEGDLIVGGAAARRSAIGTLVERTTRFTMLLHLPDGISAFAVQEAMIEAMSRLPETLRKTLTWDQGKEMTNHAAIAAATGLDIYFCDPHAPWQRGTNENTNGLLRQYFPKGSDLSVHGPGYLEFVAAELNNRPRETLGWKTPAYALDQLLSEQQPPGVALTG